MINVPQDNLLDCITHRVLIIITRSLSAEERPDCRTSSSAVQPPFTPSAFWCGCSVCSTAPAVCSLPFNNLPLAKSLILTLATAALFAFHTRRWETFNLVHASRVLIPAVDFNSAEIRCDLSPAFKSNVGSYRRGCHQCHRAKHLLSCPPEKMTYWKMAVAQKSNLILEYESWPVPALCSVYKQGRLHQSGVNHESIRSLNQLFY